MIDAALMQDHIRRANPIPHVDDIDPDELDAFTAAFHSRRTDIMETLTEHRNPTTPTRSSKEQRRAGAWAFAAAFGLIVLIAGVATFALRGSDPAAPVATTAAATESPANIESTLPEVVNEYMDAMLASDAMALAALFTDDGVMTGVMQDHSRIPVSTPPTIGTMMRIWFGYVDYTEVTHTSAIVDLNTVVVTSTWSGSATLGRGAFEPGPFTTPIVTVFELSDGKIDRCDSYYEVDQIFQ